MLFLNFSGIIPSDHSSSYTSIIRVEISLILCASFLPKTLGVLYRNFRRIYGLVVLDRGEKRRIPADSQIINPTFYLTPTLVPHHFLMPDWSD